MVGGTGPGIHARLARTGFRVDEIFVKARSNGKGAKHVIWLATRT